MPMTDVVLIAMIVAIAATVLCGASWSQDIDD